MYTELIHPLREKQLAYWGHVRNQLKARETKLASIAIRNEWIDRQNANNHQMEQDRLANTMAHSMVPNQTSARLQARQTQLEELGRTGL
jgi:hypothetical protein